MSECTYQEIKFTDEDIVDMDDWIPAGEYNPHNVRPFLLHDHGFVVAVSFGGCLQDAIDAAADADKLDRYLVGEDQYGDYPEMNTDNDTLAYLGNACEPFDIESLGVLELPNPAASFCAQFTASL